MKLCKLVLKSLSFAEVSEMNNFVSGAWDVKPQLNQSFAEAFKIDNR